MQIDRDTSTIFYANNRQILVWQAGRYQNSRERKRYTLSLSAIPRDLAISQNLVIQYGCSNQWNS